jgi:hypothetical protein
MNKPKVAAVGAGGARGLLRITAPMQRGGNRTTPRAFSTLILWNPAPSGTVTALSPLVATMLAPHLLGSIEQALREA